MPNKPAHPEPVEGPALPELVDALDFTPVPRRCNRGDVWTEQVQRDFIAALADTGSVEAACRVVGRSPASAYRLRRHPLGEGFAAAWQAAVDFAVRRIEDNAIDRAVNGVEVPVFMHGGNVVTRRMYNDRLVMFMLRSRVPERYCEGGARAMSAVDKRMLARLEKQWRAKWEEERRLLDDEEDKDALDGIDRWLGTMRDNRLANMSPAQRERQIAADAQARADQAAGWRPGMGYAEYAAAAAALLARFVAEVEAEWPPLAPWAWEGPEEEEDEAEPLALPKPSEEKQDPPEEPGGRRVRTLKDDGW